jgi:hypothetical protein
MFPASEFYTYFQAELVSRAMWAQDPETTKEELIAELEMCSSSRDHRIKVYDSFFKENKITEFEKLLMEIDYCTYVEYVRGILEHIYLLESLEARKLAA